MFIGVSFTPTSSAPFEPPAHGSTDAESEDDSDIFGSSTELRDRLRLGYLQRVEDYRSDLKKATEANFAIGAGSRTSKEPELNLEFKDENNQLQQLTIDIDQDLYTSLFDLYVFYGPAGWEIAEQALKQELARSTDRVWFAAEQFFYYTLNTLKLLVREALISLEGNAADNLVLKLGVTARRVNTAYQNDFQFKQTEKTVQQYSGRGSTAPVPRPVYRMQVTEKVVNEVFAALKDAATAREAYEQRMKRSVAAREKATSERRYSDEVASRSGFRSPYGDNRDSEKASEASKGASAAEADAKKAESDAAAAQQLFDAIQANILLNYPMALLAVPRLKVPLDVETTQDVLGGVLFEFYNRIDSIVEGLNKPSPVADDVAGLQRGVAVKAQKLETVFPHGYSLERSLARKALKGLGSNPRYFALVAPEIWNGLYQSDAIDPFERIVCMHWLATLEQETEKLRAEEEEFRAFWSRFGLGAAALSLSLIVFPSPQTSAAAGVTRVAATVADLVLLVHGLYSVATALESLDVALGKELVDLNLEGMTGMMRLAAIMNERREYREQLPMQLALELAALPFSGFRVVKQTMAWRGYLADVQTLTGLDLRALASRGDTPGVASFPP